MRIHLTQVMIETVDSFQGKQLDVVILSCVRASAESGGRRSVGFVSDLRRLNVVRGPHAVMAACEMTLCRARCAGLGHIKASMGWHAAPAAASPFVCRPLFQHCLRCSPSSA